MTKKHYALIGYPLGHSISPFIHKRLFELSNINADYNSINVHPYHLKSTFPELRNLDGFNITIPHKQKIIPLLDCLSKKSLLCKSVNTVKNGFFSEGFTTDSLGFVKALDENDIKLRGKVVIIGYGGAASSIAYECALHGCEVIIVSRPSSINNASKLVERLRTDIPFSNVNVCTTKTICKDIDLLVNATPVGMYPKINECPVFADVISNSCAVFDAIYNPMDTILLKIAKSYGIKAIGGMPMLIWQAVESHKIWNNSIFKYDDILQLEEDAQKELKKTFYEG